MKYTEAIQKCLKERGIEQEDPLYWLLGTSVQKYAPLREKILLPLLANIGGLVYNQTSSTASPLLE